ncbi:MAG: tRNA pseudouridine(55) synthase TruB [Verrucomicrobiae bacterium]|nr:tRNA pseudouridine(55) synthase TruB [Verrucomicrobiae bacterium]
MSNLQEISPYDGVLLVDKPAGPTSHDVVEAVRSVLGMKKVGHCGTLDPNATGLLVIVIGKATRLSEKFTATDKVYEGMLVLGAETDTYDADGKVVATRAVPEVDLNRLNELAGKFTGDIKQLPPMVSAVKKDGVPLYKLARKGIDVERELRSVHIYDFVFLEYEKPKAWFKVGCSKGTYVRSLVHDFGAEIGCGAYLQHLRRTVSGRFNVEDAIKMEELIKMDGSQLQSRIITLTEIVRMVYSV